MIYTHLYFESFPGNINDLRSLRNYPFIGMLYDDNSLLYTYESIIKQNDYEILYKAPLVADGNYIVRCNSSINVTSNILKPTDNNYNILQFNYDSDDKILNGWFEVGNGGMEYYCLESDVITELILPNGIEEIDALAFKCPKLTTITLPNSIKRFKSVTYTDIWSPDLETVTKSLIFGQNIETIYFDGTINEWNAIDKDLNWNPEGKTVTVICHDGDFEEFNFPIGDEEMVLETYEGEDIILQTDEELYYNGV